MDSLEKLRERAFKKSKELTNIQWKISELEESQQLPRMKKQYEGKYFKYDNGYNSTDRWWKYVFVKKVKNVHAFIYDSFQSTSQEDSFKINEECGSFLCQSKITKQEYTKQLNIFLRKANKLK